MEKKNSAIIFFKKKLYAKKRTGSRQGAALVASGTCLATAQGGGGRGRYCGRRRGGGEAVPLALLREAELWLGRRRRQRLDAPEEVVQHGADGAQRLGVGVVRVGQRVAVADGQREQLGALPAVAHRELLLHLGLAAPHPPPAVPSRPVPPGEGSGNRPNRLPLARPPSPVTHSRRSMAARGKASESRGGGEAPRAGGEQI